MRTWESCARRSAALGLLVGLAASVGCYSGAPDGGGFGDGTDAGDGDGDGGSDDGADDGDDGAPAGYEPTPVSLRLLLGHQYIAAIGDLLGEEAAAAAAPPGDTALNGFTSIGAAQLALGDSAVDDYEESARAVATAAMGNAARIDELMGCAPASATDSACMESFVTRFGRLALRRALEAEEIEQWVAVGTTSATDFDSFDAGVAAVISGMLQSPFFLYQVEVGVEDPDNPDTRTLTGYEIATRLSFFLLGTTPDETLLAAAEAGTLDSSDGIAETAAQMLARPQASVALGEFVRELYRLRDLPTLPKDTTVFPAYSTALAASMAQETLSLVQHVWSQGGDFREVFDADYTFVDAQLAAHYGIPGTFDDTFVQVDLPAEQRRGGILGHAGVLSLLAHVTSTSPTLRGKFIRESVLCQVIPPPPPEVATDLPSLEEGTMRERLEVHMSDPSCSACHAQMDPLGFGLESYDGIGQYRTLDNGLPIDDASDIDGEPFAGAQELGAALAQNPGASMCLLRNLYRHGSGHLETADEFGELMLVSDAYVEDGYRLQDGLVALVASPAFRFVGSPL